MFGFGQFPERGSSDHEQEVWFAVKRQFCSATLRPALDREMVRSATLATCGEVSKIWLGHVADISGIPTRPLAETDDPDPRSLEPCAEPGGGVRPACSI